VRRKGKRNKTTRKLLVWGQCNATPTQ